tara:strand:- start:12059 stop:13357 length:1299 start_codon:yes stop_codon:yes gene_type:complete
MKIAVIGSGYVGLVTGTCFAETGNEVLCVDNNISKIQAMKHGKIPIYEPELETLFQRNTKANRLHFTDDLAEAVAFASLIFLALPTPETEDGSADLSYVLETSTAIAELVQDYKIIVNKSTVPVGTSDRIQEIFDAQSAVEADVVSNPEFLKEGFAVQDFMKPQRIVIGSSSEKAIAQLQKLYAPYMRTGNRIQLMDPVSAELTKYASNAFLATKISFMNEIANYCELVGANVDQVRQGMGSDIRIGNRFLFPGIGYGGSCFPKDVKALKKLGNDQEQPFEIITAVDRVNTQQKKRFTFKIETHFQKNIEGKKFALWGLSFKPGTDDVREAPSFFIIETLLAQGASFSVFDPVAIENTRQYFGDRIVYSSSPNDALNNADALIVCTEWNLFRNLDITFFKNNMRKLLIFDGRNVFDPQEMKAAGIMYYSVGR